MNRTLLLSSAAAACCAAMVAGAPAASAATEATSENWAGYEVTHGSGTFSAVSGGWVQPTATCTSQSPTYSAFWVGLGGGSQSSSALEQTGTQSTCTGNGTAQYYAWYELVPKAPVKLDMKISPGDRMYARVTVNGTTVGLSLKDETTGVSVNKTLRMPNPDTSTAEWVAEAPSQCTSGAQDCTPLPLTDFGSVRFTNAYATSNGHTGSIDDPAWTAQPIALAPSSGNLYSDYYSPSVSSSNSDGAEPSSVSSNGSAFSVSYENDSAGGGYGAGDGFWGYGYDPGAFTPY